MSEETKIILTLDLIELGHLRKALALTSKYITNPLTENERRTCTNFIEGVDRYLPGERSST